MLDILEAAVATVRFTAQILIIVACAGVFAWLLTVNQVPATLVSWIKRPWRLVGGSFCWSSTCCF